MAKHAHRLFILPPPSTPLTPAAARLWLRRMYPRLSSLAAMGRHAHALRPPRHREEIRVSLVSLDGDLRAMVIACAAAIDSGRSVRIESGRLKFPPHRATLRQFRAMRRYAKANGYKLDRFLGAVERKLVQRVAEGAGFYRVLRAA